MSQITYASVVKKDTCTTEMSEIKAIHTHHMPFPTSRCQQFISLSLRAFLELVLIASFPATNLYCSPTVSASDTSFLRYAFSFCSGTLCLWQLCGFLLQFYANYTGEEPLCCHYRTCLFLSQL